MIEPTTKIKHLRNQRGLSQEKLSEKSGLSLRTIQRIENGDTIPRGDSLNRIAEVLNVSYDQLNNHSKAEKHNPLQKIINNKKYILLTILGIFTPLTFLLFRKSNFLRELLVYTVIIPIGANADTPVPGDYNGDKIVEVAVWRPETGYWYISTENRSWNDKKNNIITCQFGSVGDIPVPGDYNGDGKTDIAVWRPSESKWYISKDNTSWDDQAHNFEVIQFGSEGDIPVPEDYNGDGKTDIAVWRPSEGKWYISYNHQDKSTSDIKVIQWGENGDIPVPADYNGDGKVNIAVYRPATIGTWYISLNNQSMTPENTNFNIVQWGIPNDIPIPFDCNGDGKKDVAIWRPSTGEWHISLNNESYINDEDKNRKVVNWGSRGDYLTPLDYNGDGTDEIAVWRPSVGQFYISRKNRSWDKKKKTAINLQWGS